MGGRATVIPYRTTSLTILSVFVTVLTSHLSPLTSHLVVEAAVSSANDKQLEAGGTNQGGGTVTSSNFRQQINVGEAVAGSRMSSSNFRVLPGFLGATLSTAQAVPISALDISVLTAKTDAFGTELTPLVLQKDNHPYYPCDAPIGGLGPPRYSYPLYASPGGP